MRQLRLALVAAVTLALFAVALRADPPTLEKDLLARAAWLASLLVTVVWMVRRDRRHGRHLTLLLLAGFAAGVVWAGLWYLLQAHRVSAFVEVFTTSAWLTGGIACALLLLGIYLMHVLLERH